MREQRPRPAHPMARRLALALVVCLVVLAHALLTQGVMSQLREMEAEQAMSIKRLDTDALVADMRLSDPPVVAPPPEEPAPAAEQAAIPAEEASAASRPQPKASETAPAAAPPAGHAEALALAEPLAPAASPPIGAEAQAEAASDTGPMLASAASEASEMASAPVFEWPQATRVTFKAEGHWRGPIYGSAMVEWIRQDERYQVHVNAIAGPSFAPIASQRWTSEGLITPKGLSPRRFESINKLVIKSSKPRQLRFEGDEVELADGKRETQLPHVQDPASHYIQMAYELMLAPGRLRVGGTIDMPLAWNKRQEVIVYDIEAQETLQTPLGKVDTFRLKPRRPADQKEEILAEIWIAPSLQYLPIRMFLRKGEKDYMDMQMDKPPQQAMAAPAASGVQAETRR